jgi:hypothetical protein
MSLIEQALRRVKEPLLSSSAGPKVSAPPKAEPQASPQAHSWPADAASAPQPGIPSTPFLVASGIVLVLLAAGILFGAFWLGQLFSGGGSPSAAPTASTVPLAVPDIPDAAPPPEPAQEPARGLLSLPFLGGKEPAAAAVEFVLSGVVEGGDEPYAVINDAIVGIGQRVADATLLDIADGAVRLRRADGTEVTLRIPH